MSTQKQKEWYQAHKELTKQRAKESAIRNPRKKRIPTAKQKQQIADWRKNNKLYYKERHLKNYPENRAAFMLRKYGLTPEQYETMFKNQNGLCALNCGRSIECIDHCHKTNLVRALLCGKCNRGLGNFNDDAKLLERAAEYIVKHSAC